ncbi:MAG: hypothetical protein HUJ29_07435 [Gammaproteobacteria bacterium]|nr:hypothetical protein [Gammaproteobacteria bacterium]
MRERLFIQYNGQEPVTAQVVDTSGQPAASSHRGSLADVSAFASNRQTVIIVPADEALYFQVEVPRASKARLQQAVPYLLEDNLLQSVDHYHFALGERDDMGRISVLVIPRERMDAWQAAFEEASLRPMWLVPDIMCLPWQDGQWSLYLEQETVRVRTGQNSGFVCNWDSLSALISALSSEDESPRHVCLYGDSEELLESRLDSIKSMFDEASEIQWQQHRSDFLPLCIEHFEPETLINPLQGAYKRRREFNRQLGPWRYVAILALSLLGLAVLNYGIGYWKLVNELDWLDRQIVEEIQQGFPEIKTVRQPLNQVNQVMDQLRGQAGSSLYRKLMTSLGKGLQNSPATVLEVNFRNERLVVELQLPDLQSVNRLEQALLSEGKFAVKVLSANKQDSAVEARIQISRGEA